MNLYLDIAEIFRSSYRTEYEQIESISTLHPRSVAFMNISSVEVKTISQTVMKKGSNHVIHSTSKRVIW